MEFEKGDKGKPSGHLILYTHVRGINPLDPDAKIIAAHVVVSLISDSENIPAVTFPPTPYKDKRNMLKILQRLPAYELYRMPDFEMPPEPDAAGEYINERLEQVNDLVKDYVEICARFMRNFQPKNIQELPQPENITESIQFLEEISKKLRKTILYGKPDTELENLFQTFVDTFEKHHPEYPAHRLKALVFNPSEKADKLIRLNLEQFKAISTENYEKAEQIRQNILDLEKKSSF
ncbi:MAG: hypothetical protein D6767_05245 [Candidatus Hydrogenedentota bacterium]|nr:MAG: hypothetical protein D6767_05245 [Candidatus Hydrogenedentota bacterium]